MDLSSLGVKGRWLTANCGKYPSEKNCKLVMMAPEDQREDLLDAAVAHSVKTHGHQDTPELRGEINKLLENVEA
jgi:hypothetical protein